MKSFIFCAFFSLVFIDEWPKVDSIDSYTQFSNGSMFPIHIKVLPNIGFRAYLSPYTMPLSDLQFFAFHSNVNRPIEILEMGRYEGAVVKADSQGYWIFDETNVTLNVDDVINYWAYIEMNGTGFKVDCRSYMITKAG